VDDSDYALNHSDPFTSPLAASVLLVSGLVSRDGHGRLAACMHPLRQSGFRAVESLGSHELFVYVFAAS